MNSPFSNRNLTGRAVKLSGIAILVCAAPASADVKVEVTQSTYELRGLSREAIHEDMHRVARKDGDGIIEGEVNDDLAWKFKFAVADNSCHVTSGEITLKLSVMLPTWVDEARADESVRTVWNSYFQELKAHEDGHKTIAVDAAEKINQIAHGVKAAGPCNALEESLNDAARQIVETAEKAQDQHDADAKPFALE
ncbi:DUF922 domain-containing protein [Mesorhizobium sp. STM 4661]|uniref:DUF922 domain-containing protein n=1 Tax=Mesorhizobium sp. STM 4661 TaxID=1297570 RepID=UPI0002BF4E25|nr:DUF922 domain-containing protein [Mesorhizobium sp. STM 4661]CCV11907.1 exported hypothetical protein [Mesorhizobium sp. STM 4661]